MNLEKTSPMMQQWSQCKQTCQQALLLFRMGDFYEAFYDDAVRLAAELSLTLTQRQGIPMAGVPVVSLESALEKLSLRGHQVAVAEQTEEPKKAKGLVDRQVVRVVTPGTFTPSHDSGKIHTWIACVTQTPHLALAACDISTCELWTCPLESSAELEAELSRLRPRELISSAKCLEQLPQLRQVCDLLGCFCSPVASSHFDAERNLVRLKNHFQLHSMDGLGLKNLPGCVHCIGALVSYLQEHLRLPLHGLKSVRLLPYEGTMQIDRTCQRNLEITQPLYEGQWQNTLLHHLDHTQTPMGARLLRQWLLRPLLQCELIAKRAEAIEQVLAQPKLLVQLRRQLSNMRDLRRLASKLASRGCTPRDLVSLRLCLESLPELRAYLSTLDAGLWPAIFAHLHLQPQAVELLATALYDEPPARIGEGRIVRQGYHGELDQLLELQNQSQEWMQRYQLELKEGLGIKTLKVGYTPAFGYYIEVSKGQAALMPSHFTRRQTLVSSERFISTELKEFEDKVLHAQEMIERLERQILEQLIEALHPICPQVEATAEAIAQTDCLLTLAEVARRHGYVRPRVDESDALEIVAGRHPVVEQMIGREQFIANDTQMGPNGTRMMILTGPNMAGKSTYIRQVALLVLLAQIGSFVPAESMHLGVIDRIFTRVGASDDLARGQSTFMVEMSETAAILNGASDRSLVILDEVGRGTSTYDGIAIARAIAEFLLTCEGKRPKTLFATHYSELAELSHHFSQARNYQVAVRPWRDEVVFLHKITPGAAESSYGIHVARLAGLPSAVIERARTIQEELESHTPSNISRAQTQRPSLDPRLAPLTSLLEEVDLNQTTPMQALLTLQKVLKVWKS